MSSSIPAGERNVGQAERVFSVGAGALVALAALRRAPGALALAGLAGYLVYRGVTGRCAVYKALGLASTEPAPRELRAPSEEQIDETVDESFPASDPPGWYTGSSFTQVDK